MNGCFPWFRLSIWWFTTRVVVELVFDFFTNEGVDGVLEATTAGITGGMSDPCVAEVARLEEPCKLLGGATPCPSLFVDTLIGGTTNVEISSESESSDITITVSFPSMIILLTKNSEVVADRSDY